MIAFRGKAQDEEDGILPPERIIWAYGGISFANGKEATAILPEGRHPITLTGVDSNDQKARAMVSVRVAAVCEGDREPDGDVDGSDLVDLMQEFDASQLAIFAAN